MTFRALANDANNGSQISNKIPYQSVDLPLEKIHRICKRVIEDSNNNFGEIDVTLFENLGAICDETIKFIRMTDLVSEKESMRIEDDESFNENNIQIAIYDGDYDVGTDSDDEI